MTGRGQLLFVRAHLEESWMDLGHRVLEVGMLKIRRFISSADS